jgi:RND family efflux transporter MFP subunit
MRKRTSLIVAAGIALPVLAGIIAYSFKDRHSATTAAVIPSATVVAVTRGTIAHTLKLAGQFQPYQVVDVHAKVSGYIKHIYVDIGDKVQAGQTLAILEVPELNAQLKGTVSQFGRSKDEITRAQHEVARAESEHSAVHADYLRLLQASTAQPGLIAQQELDNAQSKDLSTAAQIDAAKATLSGARQGADVADADRERVQDLNDYTHVTAPLSGIIVWRYADTGALIQAGTASDTQTLPLVKLSQSSLLRLRLPVPEDAVSFIHEGAEVNVTVDAIHRTLVGKVVRFTRDISLATGTMETEIDVENNDLSLTPGMYANTTLELERMNNVLLIPVQAVIRNGNQASVLMVDNGGRVQARNVALGMQGTMLVEVKSGLNEGDKVIIGGQSNYQPGEVVRPRLEDLPTADVSQEQSGGDK